MGLDLKAYLKRYHATGERRHDFSAIEKRFAPLRDGRKWLTADDVLWMLHPDNAPFGVAGMSTTVGFTQARY
jgi:hypothetical protein